MESFRRAFGELSESFRRACFWRAFGELSESMLSESFGRAFVEPAFGDLSESLLSEAFRRAFGELFMNPNLPKQSRDFRLKSQDLVLLTNRLFSYDFNHI